MHDTSKKTLDAIVEAALQSYVTERCQRAYLHQLRNGLQGIYTGFDLLIRMLTGKIQTAIPTDKASDIVRRAIGSHEQSMELVLKQMVLQSDPPTAVAVDVMVREVIALLNNDAAAHGVTLRRRC
jgi:hypothetical protein